MKNRNIGKFLEEEKLIKEASKLHSNGFFMIRKEIRFREFLDFLKYEFFRKVIL